MSVDKPNYRIQSMSEIRNIPWNGLKVASLFAGGGGSSTGYRMAGCRVLFANEFVDEAAETYRQNCAPYTIVNQEDIRSLDGAYICKAAGAKVGELDILDGSPPCASFSIAGAVERLWGREKQYSDGKVQRTDNLFQEYARLVSEIRPKVIVAENVYGLVQGSSVGFFIEILELLRSIGYNVEVRLIDSRWLGVPQDRRRLFFIGVRNDINKSPCFPSPLRYSYTLRDACPWINDDSHCTLDIQEPFVENESWMNSRAKTPDKPYAVGKEWERLRVGEKSEKYFQLVRCHPDRHVPTLAATSGDASAASPSHPFQCRKFSIAEAKRLSGFPDDYKLTGSYVQQFERCGRAVTPPVMKAIAETISERILNA